MKTGAPITMNFETFLGDEYWNDTGKVRDMSPRAQDLWEQRLQQISAIHDDEAFRSMEYRQRERHNLSVSIGRPVRRGHIARQIMSRIRVMHSYDAQKYRDSVY